MACIRLLAAVLVAAVLPACGAGEAGDAARRDGSGRVDAKRKSHLSETERLREDNAQLSARVDQLLREREQLGQSNTLLQEELTWAHEDFYLVERQFSEFEQKLANSDNGKASAVAGAAEARMHYDRVRQDKGVAIPDSTLQHVLRLVTTAEKLVREQNYTAALFFAERADHTLASVERRSRIASMPNSLSVAVTTANIRSGPGPDFDVVGRVVRDSVLLCLDVSNDWYRVRTPSGADGWIHTSLVR